MAGGIWVIKERWDGFVGVTVTVAAPHILAHSHHTLISPSTHTSAVKKHTLADVVKTHFLSCEPLPFREPQHSFLF